MVFYTGHGDPKGDDFHMEEFGGFYTNPDNPDEWSSEPYPQQRKEIARVRAVKEYCNGRYSLNDVYQQIQDKTCGLPRSLRDYVIEIMEKI
jgi:hypothetical protein